MIIKILEIFAVGPGFSKKVWPRQGDSQKAEKVLRETTSEELTKS